MEAKPMTLHALFGQDQRLVVPVFQRPYVWNEQRNWRPLWEDVVTLTERQLSGDVVPRHFLGAVVLDQLSTATGSMPARQVIDGQQRLTTLQVLLAAIRDVAREREPDVPVKYRRALEKLTCNDDVMSDDPHAVYKVWPTHMDRDSFRAVMDGARHGSVDATTPAGPESPVILQAYRFFLMRTAAWARELDRAGKLDEGFDAMVRVLREKFELIVIDLKPDDNAQVIFESLNDRGTPLQASDLVKNLIFQKAEEQGLPVERLHQEVWSYLETQDWRDEVRQGRLKRPRLDVFLGQYLTCELAEEVMVPELFLTFRRYVGDTDADLTALVEQLVQRAKLYRKLTAHDQPPTPEGRFLRGLRVLETSTVAPVMLFLMNRYSEAERAAAVTALDSYLVRRTVCRETTKNYNRLFLELLKELKAKDDPAVVESFLLGQGADSGFWPGNDRIRQVFAREPLYNQLTKARLRFVLGELEDTLYDGRTERTVYRGDLTIEHLLPQAWQAHWPLPEAESRAELESLRESLLHTMGNLTLLSQKLNPALSNGPWESKLPEILSHSVLYLNRRLPSEWNEETITTRAGHLADTFCRRWPRPEEAGASSSVAGYAAAPYVGSPSESGRLTVGGVPRPRRDVALHLEEVFSSFPIGTVLTVAEIVAARSTQYAEGEISGGAVAARLDSGDLPGISPVPGSSPRAARKTG